MKKYLENTLGIKVSEIHFFDENALPLFLKNDYQIVQLSLEGSDCLFLIVKDKANLSTIKKHFTQFSKFSPRIAFVFSTLTDYQRKRLIEMRISFVVPEKQIYLPFLGLVLQNSPTKKVVAAKQLTPMAQRIFLSGIYGKWSPLSITQIADKSGVSKMTVSRCIDEIEATNHNLVSSQGRTRILTFPNDRYSIYKAMLPFLITPVHRSIFLQQYDFLSTPLLAGLSALSEYSMIADNTYLTYAITKSEFQELLKQRALIKSPEGEDPIAVLEIWEYLLPFGKSGSVDPLSLSLSLSKEAETDERINIAINEMLEEMEW